jgi:hypothetical protein
LATGGGRAVWTSRPCSEAGCGEQPIGGGGYADYWRTSLVAQAEAIAANRLSFFDLAGANLGDPVRWNRDHKLGLDTPMGFAPGIDYRDVRVSGDCKFVWEPSRHHQLVVLGRAYRVTGDTRYARVAIGHMESWMNQCPFGLGMQWRSPMELAIRLINWVWTLDLIGPSGLVDGEFGRRLRQSIYLHLGDITRKYSRYSSANNHTIGEAAGVFVATQCLGGLPKAERWRQEAKELLTCEALRQTFADGGGREQAVGYELFVAQFLLLAGLVARRAGDDFPSAYWQRLERMFEFLSELVEGGGSVPAFGDGDDGYVLDLGVGLGGYQDWLAAAAVAFGRGDFAVAAGGFSETAWWLFGQSGRETFEALATQPRARTLVSRGFPETGLYLLQAGTPGQSDRISVTFDCGRQGLEPLVAHGHADALSLTLRAYGKDVLVDPGTYDYFSYPKWRQYFRSTRAHNTVEIDRQDQSEILGLFLWGRRANARCLTWEPNDQGGTVVGEHDGYARLKGPVIHRRMVELNGRQRTVTVRDDLQARGRHEVSVYLHLAEHCRVSQVGPSRFMVDVGPGCVTIQFDTRLSVQALTGSEDPIGGWVSRGYHQKTASTTLIGCCTCDGNLSLLHHIGIGESQTRTGATVVGRQNVWEEA